MRERNSHSATSAHTLHHLAGLLWTDTPSKVAKCNSFYSPGREPDTQGAACSVNYQWVSSPFPFWNQTHLHSKKRKREDSPCPLQNSADS